MTYIIPPIENMTRAWADTYMADYLRLRRERLQKIRDELTEKYGVLNYMKDFKNDLS